MASGDLIGSVVGATLGPIVGLYSDYKNRQFQREQNALDWQHTQEMYNRQRQDALFDWNMTNNYNSPANQMTRLRQAGLNPHLVYGKGAETTAAMVRSSSQTPFHQQAPKMDLSGLQNAFTGYLQIRQAKAQTDNINALTAVAKEDAILRAAQTAGQLQNTAKTKFELEQAMELKQDVIERAKLENEKLKADISFTQSQEFLNTLTTSANVKYTVARTITEQLNQKRTELQMTTDVLQQDKLKQEIKNLEVVETNLQKQGTGMDLDNAKKQIEIWLKEHGMNENDPMVGRMLMQFLNRTSGENIYDWLKNQTIPNGYGPR